MLTDIPCPNNGKVLPQGGEDRAGGCPYCNWWRMGLEFRAMLHPMGRVMDIVPWNSVRVEKPSR